MKTYPILIFVIFISGLLYANPYQLTTVADVTLQYRTSLDSNNLECILSAPTTGWVAVGFNPSDAMLNGNFIIAYVMNNTLTIRDDWGSSLHGHSADISLGGTDNIISSSGTESVGVTEISFSIPLNSGDTFDQPLIIGQTYPIILAYGIQGVDSFTSAHANRGVSSISITSPVSNFDETAALDLSPFTLAAYPNPFSAVSSLEFTVKGIETARLNVYNLKGQLVSSYGEYERGEHKVQLNSFTGLASGMYLCRLENQKAQRTIKLFYQK